MEEKYLRTNISKQSGYTYEIYYGSCVMMRGTSKKGKPIYWFGFNMGDEMRKTWTQYEYFVDEEGDISRRDRL